MTKCFSDFFLRHIGQRVSESLPKYRKNGTRENLKEGGGALQTTPPPKRVTDKEQFKNCVVSSNRSSDLYCIVVYNGNKEDAVISKALKAMQADPRL